MKTMTTRIIAGKTTNQMQAITVLGLITYKQYTWGLGEQARFEGIVKSSGPQDVVPFN